MSGPLLDRIDIQVEVSAVPFKELSAGPGGSETSATVRARVEEAVRMQTERFHDSPTRFNGQMDSNEVRRHCAVPEDAARILEHSMDRLGLSARALDRILKVARTIADLEGSRDIRTEHVGEAVQYRLLDRATGAHQGKSA